jgi:hypothetical protein
MTKWLLAVGLMLAQLLPGVAAPLYLCLDSDGSISIDFGPDCCACCLDDHQPAGADATLVADEHEDCDCAHIQISKSTGPVMLSSSSHRAPDPMLSVFACRDGHSSLAAADRLLLHRPPGRFTPLLALGSIALRC